MKQEERQELAYSLCRSVYARSLGFGCYPWQTHYLDSHHRRRILKVARQGGKSYTTVLIPTHTAKYEPGSLSIVAAATERQAGLDMKKILEFISKDRRYPDITRSSDDLIQLENRSEIVVVPATEKSARGDTRPRVIVVDEGAYVFDRVIRTGIRPMLNNNPGCEFLILSTPNGRQGFFFRAFSSPSWQRFEVIAPFQVNDASWELIEDVPEPEYQARMAERGILAWYSPEHMDLADQSLALQDVGPSDYRQEYRCEFIERMGQVFGYDDIDAMMGGSTEQAMETGDFDTVTEPALEEVG